MSIASESSGKLDELYGRFRESKKNLEFACYAFGTQTAAAAIVQLGSLLVW